MAFHRLREIDSLSSTCIQTLSDATSYVHKAARDWGFPESNEINSTWLDRLAKAEFIASEDMSVRVSDASIAAAFNEFVRILEPLRPVSLAEQSVRAFRIIWSSAFPHLFEGPQLRPVAASILFYLLVFNEGISESAVRMAENLEGSGSTKFDFRQGRLRPAWAHNEAEKQNTYLDNFLSTSPQQRAALLNKIAIHLRL